MVVVDYFYLGKNLGSVKLIYFVGKGVSCQVCLQSQLQFGNYLLLESYLKSNVRNRNWIVESALYLNQSVTARVISNIFFYFIDSFDDILDRAEDALTSYHVTDGKQDWLLVLQLLLYLVFIVLVFLIQLLVDVPHNSCFLLSFLLIVIFE